MAGEKMHETPDAPAAAGTESSSTFPKTVWQQILAAADTSTNVRLPALGAVLRRYLPCLKKHLITRRGLQEQDADDLLQQFVLEKILEGELLRSANPDKGRFRSWLLTVLTRFTISDWRKRTAVRRIQAATYGEDFQSVADGTAANSEIVDIFEIDWACSTIQEVLTQMERECSGNPRIWEVFRHRVLLPCMEGREPMSYEELWQKLRFATPTQASNALVTGKRMFQRILREVIGQYEVEAEGIEQEIRNLREALSKPRHSSGSVLEDA